MVKLTKFRQRNGLSTIAQPLLSEKNLKKSLKLVKKACKDKLVKRGVKEVNKGLRKLKDPSKQCICLIAGDISPIDVVAHLPAYCESLNVGYAFVPSKDELGAACKSKRPTSCLLVTSKIGKEAEDWELRDTFEEMGKKLKKLIPEDV
eukprot:snap_masked-scaffold_4-processed-gene-18.19-mRNA-1 protein AED:0.07 eAED:0.07 QI:0/-1/0/1/-1/1/1/0/147